MQRQGSHSSAAVNRPSGSDRRPASAAPAGVGSLRSGRDVGTALRAARGVRGLTQAEAAVSAGVPPEWVRDVEGGKPRLAVGPLLRLVWVLGHRFEFAAEPGNYARTLGVARAPSGAHQMGAALRWMRRQRRMTQQQAAKAAGVSRGWVSSVERGKPGADIRRVLQLVEALGYEMRLMPKPEPAFDLEAHLSAFRKPSTQTEAAR